MSLTSYPGHNGCVVYCYSQDIIITSEPALGSNSDATRILDYDVSPFRVKFKIINATRSSKVFSFLFSIISKNNAQCSLSV